MYCPNYAVSVYEKGTRDACYLVSIHHLAIGVVGEGPGVVVKGQVLVDNIEIVLWTHRDSYYFKLPHKPVIQLSNQRHFAATWRTPRTPKVEHYRLTAQVGQFDRRCAPAHVG